MQAYLDLLKGEESSLSTLNDEVVNELFSAISAWESSYQDWVIIGSIISHADKDLAILDVEQFVAMLNDAGADDVLVCITLHELVIHKMIQPNLNNAIFLARMANEDDAFDWAVEFETFTLAYLEKGDMLRVESGPDGVYLLAAVILRYEGTNNSKAKELFNHLKEDNRDVFPINILDVLTEDVGYSPELLTDLYETDMLVPAWTIYRLIHNAPWRFRERILLRWDKTDTSVRLFGPRRSMLLRDFALVISSYRLRGTRLWEDVCRNWKDYLETSGLDDDCIELLSMEIEQEIEALTEGECEEQ